MIEPRILVGPALLIIGALLLTFAARLWFIHPVNRAFRVGPFVTERGFRELLKLRLTFFAWGVFLVTVGGSYVAYWAGVGMQDFISLFFAHFSAVFGAASVYLAGKAAVQLWIVR